MNETSKCKVVDDHIFKPIPEKLWHYTSFAAFEKIVNSKEVWATDYRFLNDSEEFLHAKKLVQELVGKVPKHGRRGFPARLLIETAVNAAFSAGALDESRLRIMVASFSEEGDQLSQWRGYCKDSSGVSIGLDLRHLRHPSKAGGTVVFAPCIYKRTEKLKLLRSIIRAHRSYAEDWFYQVIDIIDDRHSKTENPEPIVNFSFFNEYSPKLKSALEEAQKSFERDLIKIAPLLKDESFSEEKEWRLVLLSEPITMPMKLPVAFRPTRNALVPYVAFPLLLPSQTGEIPCNDLILGPGSHPAAQIGVDLFFQQRFMTLQARLSQIPYRPA